MQAEESPNPNPNQKGLLPDGERSSPEKVCCLMGKGHKSLQLQSPTYRMEFPDCIFNTQTLFFKAIHNFFSFISFVPLHGYRLH